VNDFYPGELTVCFEGKLQVAVYEKLVETFGIAAVGHIVQLKLDRGAAATRGRGINVAKHTTGAEDNGLGALEFHNGYLLAFAPEDLGCDAGGGFGMAAKDEGFGGLVKAVELGRAGAVGTH